MTHFHRTKRQAKASPLLLAMFRNHEIMFVPNITQLVKIPCCNTKITNHSQTQSIIRIKRGSGTSRTPVQGKKIPTTRQQQQQTRTRNQVTLHNAANQRYGPTNVQSQYGTGVSTTSKQTPQQQQTFTQMIQEQRKILHKPTGTIPKIPQSKSLPANMQSSSKGEVSALLGGPKPARSSSEYDFNKMNQDLDTLGKRWGIDLSDFPSKRLKPVQKEPELIDLTGSPSSKKSQPELIDLTRTPKGKKTQPIDEIDLTQDDPLFKNTLKSKLDLDLAAEGTKGKGKGKGKSSAKKKVEDETLRLVPKAISVLKAFKGLQRKPKLLISNQRNLTKQVHYPLG